MVSINTQIVNKLFPLGVVLAAERKEHSKLFVPTKESGKLYKIDNHILASVSGIVADANYLIDYSRVHC
jgi:proteasome alpha subunit